MKNSFQLAITILIQQLISLMLSRIIKINPRPIYSTAPFCKEYNILNKHCSVNKNNAFF